MTYLFHIKPDGTATLVCIQNDGLAPNIHESSIINEVDGSVEELLDMISRDAAGDAEDHSDDYITKPLSREERRELFTKSKAA